MSFAHQAGPIGSTGTHAPMDLALAKETIMDQSRLIQLKTLIRLNHLNPLILVNAP
jgi:hypothetical protein